jgi:hypothetical protein
VLELWVSMSAAARQLLSLLSSQSQQGLIRGGRHFEVTPGDLRGGLLQQQQEKVRGQGQDASSRPPAAL